MKRDSVRLPKPRRKPLCCTSKAVFLEVNQTLADHLGYTVAELLGREVLEFTAPESREEMKQRILAGDPGPYLAYSLHKDGSRTIGEIRARQIFYQGRPVRVVAMRDITAQKHAEDALRASESLFHSLADNANVVVSIVQDRRFVYVNPFFLALIGFTQEELLTMDIAQVVAPSYRDMVMERARLRQNGDPSVPPRYEFIVVDKKGQEHWVDFAAGVTEYHGLRRSSPSPMTSPAASNSSRHCRRARKNSAACSSTWLNR